jgi:hypothetical protein
MATKPVSAQDGTPSRDNARPGVVTAAVVVAVWFGLGNIIQGLGHIQGVVETATRRGYPYDFRYAGLLLVGIMIVYSGVLFLWAVRGLARGERPAWDRALSGTILMLLVAVPLIPLEGPGQDNAILQAAVPGTVSLIVLLAAWPRLGTFIPSDAVRLQPSAAAGRHCGRCGQVLSPYWRERCGVCKAPFSEFPPVSVPT